MIEHSSARLEREVTEDLEIREYEDFEADPLARARKYEEPLAELSRHWTALAASLRRAKPDLSDLANVRKALEQAHGHKLTENQRDLVLYAVDLGLRRWAAGDSSVRASIQTSLADFDVRFVKTYDCGWCYVGGLRDSIAHHAGHNHWADLAFLELLDAGWESPCSPCGYDPLFGPDEFRPVLEHGEAFLKEFPHSVIAPEVALRVAQAHETAWSLSKSAPGDEYIQWDLYILDAAQHRTRAIELYQDLIKKAVIRPRPTTMKRLRRMRLDVDTDYHRYWCLWD